MRSIEIGCPSCGTINEIAASDTSETLEVRCSHCRGPLGTLDAAGWAEAPHAPMKAEAAE